MKLKHLKKKLIRQLRNFFIRKEMNDIEEVRQMWMKTLSNFTYPPFSVSGEFIQDEEGVNMAPQVDNRGVFGVLIINKHPIISNKNNFISYC